MTAPILDGVVLAAGLSTRAGGGKLTMELEGQAILARCLEGMYDVCARIIVVTGHRRESLLPILRTHAKVEEVHNPDYAGGMFGSVLAGVRQVKAERFFLTPGDYPLIAKSTYTTLLGAGGDVAIPVFDGKRGHPLLMSSRLLAELFSYPVTATLEDFIRRQGAALVPVQDPGILMDVDTMEDFRRARGYLAQARPGLAGEAFAMLTGFNIGVQDIDSLIWERCEKASDLCSQERCEKASELCSLTDRVEPSRPVKEVKYWFFTPLQTDRVEPSRPAKEVEYWFFTPLLGHTSYLVPRSQKTVTS